MFTSRTLSGPPSEYLSPLFLIVNFSDSFFDVTVSTHLRHAWTALPTSESPTDETVISFAKANHALTPDQRRELIPQNEDKDTINTSWRVVVLEHWIPVFAHVSVLLKQDVGPGIGHLRAYDVFAIEYPSLFSDKRLEVKEVEDMMVGKMTTKVWDTNVLLIPAHLEPGVSLRTTILQINEDGNLEEGELGTFSEASPTECWYVRRGVVVHIYVEGDHKRDCEGIAVVLAICKLCLEDHGKHEGEREDGEKGERRRWGRSAAASRR